MSLPTRLGSCLALAAATHSVANALLLRRPPAAATVTERVSVLVPARNEAARIGGCLATLRAQRQLADFEIVVCDDNSTDATARVVREAGGGQVRLIAAGEPPPGALGKPWACHRLAGAATGSVLVFVDADVTLAPDGVARTVGLLRARGFSFVSPYPRQLADGLLPRLVQPLLCWSLLSFLPLRLAESARAPVSMAVANGQLLAVDAAAYAAAGGHAGVAGEVIEDLALARLLRRAGGAGGVVDGSTIASCRMYRTAAELTAGYTKSGWAAFGSPAGAVAAAAAAALVYLAPPIAALRGSRAGRLGYAAGVAGRLIAVARTGGRWAPDPLAHPISVTLAIWLLARSWWARAHGTLTWKDRRLP